MRHDQPPAGDLALHPAFARRLAALGIDTPERILDLPGEVVSGHPDRHVLRVHLPGFPTAFYLKRQHVVTRRERFRNWRAGFGWVSRSERERVLLEQLAAAGLPGPRWVAAGEDGSGRAFLLVEELEDSNDLRGILRTTDARGARGRLADQIGNLIDRLHRSGFTTPDLAAKHLLVAGNNVTPIDWQNARRVERVNRADRVRALAALQASVAPELATPRERLRVLRAALRSARAEDIVADRFSTLVALVEAEAKRLGARRSFRDQRITSSARQRLVWVAGEAVCAIPDVAANWPVPATAPPFYDVEPGRLSIHLHDGLPAELVRGRSFDPLGRLSRRLRGKPWRSPGAILGRILFHLERFEIPAPQLLAFGQRFTGRARAEWFALHTPPAPPITSATPEIAEQLGQRLRQLHEAGCRPAGDPRQVFGMDELVAVRDVTAIRLVKRVSRHERLDDLRRLTSTLPGHFGSMVRAGYGAVDGVCTPSTEELITSDVNR